MKIADFDTDRKVMVIAEIGNNHEGDFELAGKMIEAAAAAGANAVKFQTIVPNRLVSASDVARVQQLSRFQLTPDQFRQLHDEAVRQNVLFLSTPFDPDCVEWLNELVPAWKIASGDNDFFPLIDRVAATGKPVITSMGLGQSNRAQNWIQFIERAWERHGHSHPGLSLMHCRVSYPTPADEAGLGAIEHLKLPGVTPGYSDHTLGIRAVELAVAAGARVIEKHFTLDKNYSDFRDHQLSADPEDLIQMVSSIREIETMMNFEPASELSNEKAVRRSIAAKADFPEGHVVAFDDLCWVRPGDGIRPGNEEQICGKALTRPITSGEAFTLDHVS